MFFSKSFQKSIDILSQRCYNIDVNKKSELKFREEQEKTPTKSGSSLQLYKERDARRQR